MNCQGDDGDANTKAAKSELERHIGPVLRELGKIASSSASLSLPTEAREAAVGALAATASLNYHKVYPHRSVVLDALTAALDDKKRPVRRAAAMAKEAWTKAFPNSKRKSN